MIDKLRTYIATCPYLEDYTAVNVEYLVDKVTAYSLNESVSYDPIIESDIVGNETRQFLFTFDSKFYWNEEIQNNVDNSTFYYNFREWLENNSKGDVLPTLNEGETAIKIEALTNGYIFLTNTDEAIYRIQCKLTYLKYFKEYEEEELSL